MKNFGSWFCLAVICAATAAWGDTPPPWSRSASGATYSVWNFVTSATNPAPDVVYNPYGTASGSVNYNPPVGTGWYGNAGNGNYTNSLGAVVGTTSVYGSVPYFWDIANGSMSFSIPTAPANGLPETNQIQVTYYVDIDKAPTISVAGGTQIGSTTVTETGIGGAGEWYTELETWLIQPGTGSDIITILGNSRGSVIDQVIVDTLTVPEPSTISLAALGVAAFVGSVLRRRRSSR